MSALKKVLSCRVNSNTIKMPWHLACRLKRICEKAGRVKKEIIMADCDIDFSSLFLETLMDIYTQKTKQTLKKDGQ